MAEASAHIEVFCCYAHADETWLRKLEIHLSLLQRQGLISLWHDRRITAGTDWAKAIGVAHLRGVGELGSSSTVLLFLDHWTEIAQGRMATLPIGDHFDGLKDRPRGPSFEIDRCASRSTRHTRELKNDSIKA